MQRVVNLHPHNLTEMSRTHPLPQENIGANENVSLSARSSFQREDENHTQDMCELQARYNQNLLLMSQRNLLLDRLSALQQYQMLSSQVARDFNNYVQGLGNNRPVLGGNIDFSSSTMQNQFVNDQIDPSLARLSVLRKPQSLSLSIFPQNPRIGVSMNQQLAMGQSGTALFQPRHQDQISLSGALNVSGLHVNITSNTRGLNWNCYNQNF